MHDWFRAEYCAVMAEFQGVRLFKVHKSRMIKNDRSFRMYAFMFLFIESLKVKSVVFVTKVLKEKKELQRQRK